MASLRDHTIFLTPLSMNQALPVAPAQASARSCARTAEDCCLDSAERHSRCCPRRKLPHGRGGVLVQGPCRPCLAGEHEEGSRCGGLCALDGVNEMEWVVGAPEFPHEVLLIDTDDVLTRPRALVKRPSEAGDWYGANRGCSDSSLPFDVRWI